MIRSLIRAGDSGDDVRALQTALREARFNPGEIDGEFGSGTEQALIAYQLSRKLLADGVAGPRSLTALGLLKDDSLPDATTGMSSQVASRMCPGAPLANVKANLPLLIDSLIEHKLHDRTMVLMAVASIRAETGSFLPISEGISKYNTSPSGKPFDLYDYRADLGNKGKGDGQKYCGRGFIQLTGRYNYKKYGDLLKPPVNLEADPDRANDAQIAADLLCLFLGDRKQEIKQAIFEKDYRTARKLVNGGSHGLTEFTDAYQTGDALLPPV
jgi:peptidoglycan L-alanyl-D-glutamate endopeptidase CwlK